MKSLRRHLFGPFHANGTGAAMARSLVAYWALYVGQPQEWETWLTLLWDLMPDPATCPICARRCGGCAVGND